jgi:uncharacterized protein (TIGR02594 family)
MKVGPPYLKDLAKLAGWAIAMILIFTFISALAATAADAHGRHLARHHYAHRTHADRHPVRVVVSGVQSHWWNIGSSLVSEARSQLGNGAIYGRANLWCARFVNYVLKETGHSGTNSDTAASFAHYGTPVSGPQVGAIAVMSRRGGGHVGIVSGVDGDGNPVIISGNHLNRVREAVYPRSRVYAYRLP